MLVDVVKSRAAYRKKYALTNGEKKRELERNHYKKNAEKIKARRKAYRKNNIEKVKEAQRKGYEKNKARRRAKILEWQQKNPEKYNAIRKTTILNRIARRKKAEGRHTIHDIRALYDKQKGLCPACECSLLDGYHVDHMTPLSRGGSNWPDNLQLLCPNCNCSKHNKTMVEFMKKRIACHALT